MNRGPSLHTSRASVADVARGLLMALALPVLGLACAGGGGGAGGEPPAVTAARAIEMHSDSLMALPGVVGVYEGRSASGATVIRVMLAARTPETDVILSPVANFSITEGNSVSVGTTLNLINTSVNNTTNVTQDMMGSMFLFFYDKELDSIVNKSIQTESP